MRIADSSLANTAGEQEEPINPGLAVFVVELTAMYKSVHPAHLGLVLEKNVGCILMANGYCATIPF